MKQDCACIGTYGTLDGGEERGGEREREEREMERSRGSEMEAKRERESEREREREREEGEMRAEERRGGKECVRECRSRWAR